MAQPADLVKLVTVFDLVDDSNAPQETAEFGIWGKLTADPASSPEWDHALQQLAQGAVNGWSSTIPPDHYSHGAKLKQCRAIRADAAGHTANEQVSNPATPWQGTATAHSLPWSSTLVVSLYTYTPGSFIAFAGRRRGRVYPPPLNVSVLETTNQGEIHPDTALIMLNNFGAWLSLCQSSIADPAPNPWIPGVLSVTGGNWNHVTDLAIDTKIDTQRRRERSQQAVRQSVAF